MEKNRAEKIYMWLFYCAVLLCSFMVFHSFIFGEHLFAYRDVNDDTFQSYLPAYQLVVNRIKGGTTSLMDMRLGFGDNILTMQMVICDPFAIPLYIIGVLVDERAVAHALVYTHILRIICAAGVCSFFLSSFKLSLHSRYVASFLYAFSAFILGDIGQHYMFATALVFAALLLGLVEKTATNRKYLLHLAICVGVCICWSIYFAYMILLTCAVYAIIRWLFCGSLSVVNFAYRFLPLLFSVVIGVFLSGAVFIPAAHLLFSTSSRMVQEISWQEKWKIMSGWLTVEQLLSYILRLFSNQLQGTINQWDGAEIAFKAAHFFCSVLLPIAVPQYIAYLLKKKGREKIVAIVTIVLLSFACTTRIAGTVMNAFVEYMARYTFVLIPIFSYVMAWFLDNVWTSKCNVSLLNITVIVCVCTILYGTNYKDSAALFSGIVAIVCISAVLVAILTGKRSLKCRNTCKWVLVAILIINICVDGWVAIAVKRNIVTKDWYKTTGINDTVNSFVDVTHANEDEFWRLERNFIRWGNEQAFSYSEVGNFRNISFYNSMMKRNIGEYQKYILGKEDIKISNCYAFNSFGIAMDAILADFYGIKYVVSDYATSDISWKLIDEKDGKFLYKNTSLNSAGLLYDTWISEETVAELKEEEKESLLADTVVLERFDSNRVKTGIVRAPQILDTLVDCEQVTVSKDESIVLDVDVSQILKEDAQVWIQFTVKSDNEGLLRLMCDVGFGFDETYWAQETLTFNTVDNLLVRIPPDTQRIKVDLLTEGEIKIEKVSGLIKEGKYYTNNNVHLFNDKMNGYIYGTVKTEEPQILVIPVCVEDGWSAYLNGNEVEILTANYMFAALEVPEGDNFVELRYCTPGVEIGLCLTIIGVFLLCLLAYKVYFVESKYIC